MIVDNDVDAGKRMAEMSEVYGYKVRRGADLQSAIQVGEEFHPQAVLKDISLPDADRCEVARRLSAITCMREGVVYVAVTGFGQPKDSKRSNAAGSVHQLVNPVDLNELDQILRRGLVGCA